MLPHSKDVVAEVGNPQTAELLVLGLRLLWEGSYKRATSDASCVSHRPALVFKAIDKGFEQGCDVFPKWLLLLIVCSNFVTDFADAVTCSLSDGMIVSQ